MQIRTFTVPIDDDGRWNEELNRFLRSHRVLEVDDEFVQDGSRSCWCFCVRYLDGSIGSAGAGKGPRIDYKEVLDESTFAKFAALRAKRKQIAEVEGIPAYAVFTDEQLAEMAKLEKLTPATMAKVKGVGAGKVERYAVRMLAPTDGDEQTPDDESHENAGADKAEGSP